MRRPWPVPVRLALAGVSAWSFWAAASSSILQVALTACALACAGFVRVYLRGLPSSESTGALASFRLV